MLQINVGLKLCLCETACGWFEWLCCLPHPQAGCSWCGLGGGEQQLRQNPGLCSWRSLPMPCCWWSSAKTRLEQLIMEKKLCLAAGGAKSHPLKGSASFSPALEGAAVHVDEGKAPRSAAKRCLQMDHPFYPAGDTHREHPMGGHRVGDAVGAVGLCPSPLLAHAGGERSSAALTWQRDCSSCCPLCRRMSHLGEGNC